MVCQIWTRRGQILCYFWSIHLHNQVPSMPLKYKCWEGITQIAFMCWTNVGFLLAILLDQRWQMTLGQRNFVHLPLDGPTSWAFVGPMISANNVYNLLTRCQHIFGGKYDGPTLAQYYLPTRYQQMVKINNPVRKMSTSPNRIPVSNGGPPTSFCAKVSFWSFSSIVSKSCTLPIVTVRPSGMSVVMHSFCLLFCFIKILRSCVFPFTSYLRFSRKVRSFLSIAEMETTIL